MSKLLARICDTKTFKNIFINISNILEDIRLIVSKEGIKVNAINNAHNIFFKLNISHYFFNEYELDEDFQISIDCDGFEKILKRCLSDDVIYIEVTPDDFNLK